MGQRRLILGSLDFSTAWRGLAACLLAADAQFLTNAVKRASCRFLSMVRAAVSD
jgi:hypothetical protein